MDIEIWQIYPRYQNKSVFVNWRDSRSDLARRALEPGRCTYPGIIGRGEVR